MIPVNERGHLGLVAFGISLQTRNPLFDGAAKSGTDFKAVIGDAVGRHGNLLGEKKLEA
jgi:hypothetical protein